LNQVAETPLTYDGGRLRAVPIADEVQPLEVCFARVSDVRATARTRVVATLARELFGSA
ncbi:MAG: LysR family transcriptional regulator, partial [Microbacterium sp. 13-71-7]